MADEKVKLPRSSYEEFTKIIKAYGQSREAASLDDISKLSAVGRTVVSGNNAFLSAIGVIEGGNAKSATSQGKALALALMHEIPNEIQSSWQRIVEESPFLKNMVLAVRIRRGMSVQNFISHIAFSSGEKKSAKVLTGAKTVVDIIRASGLVREKDDKIIPVTEVVLEGGPDESGPTSDEPTSTSDAVSISLPSAPQTATGVSVTIQLRVDAKPEELDGLGKKLRDLLSDLSAGNENDDSAE